MARPRKIKSPKELLTKWEEFKYDCDNKTAICNEFSSSKGAFVSVELKKPITYTIEGFCVYIGVSRQSFYDYYANNSRFADIVTYWSIVDVVNTPYKSRKKWSEMHEKAQN